MKRWEGTRIGGWPGPGPAWRGQALTRDKRAESLSPGSGPRLALAAAMAPLNTKSLSGSTWLPMALRALAVALALVVLAWIGKTAAAGSSAAASLAAASSHDASAPMEDEAGTRAPPAFASAPPAVGAPAAQAAGGARARASASEPVFLNHAGVEELRRLPGVGPKRAEAILVLRQRLGRFRRVEDLLRVKGVGRGAVKKWRPLVRLDAPPTSAGESADGADGGLR